MKKLILTLATMFMLAANVSAQSKWSQWDILFMPHAGATYSTMTDNDNDWKVGMAVGAAFQIYFSPRWAMDLDLTYTHEGSRNQYETVDGVTTGPYNYRLNYINADYLFRYYPIGKFSVGTGVHLGRLFSPTAKYRGKSDKLKNDLHVGTVSIPVVMAYDFGDFAVDGRFYYPLNALPDSHRAKNILEKGAREISFLLTVGYKIQMF